MMHLLRRKKLKVDAVLKARLQQLPSPPSVEVALSERLVVLDVEATGLNTRKDNILAIGAVAITEGALVLGDSFYCVLRREHHPNESVLIHRLGPEALARGVSVEDGLLAFLEFVGASPLFAFHSPFDEQLLVRECKQRLQYRLANDFLDVAQIAPLLMQKSTKDATLEDWVNLLNLPMLERHNALADAYVTAKMLMMFLHQAKRIGIHSLSELKAALTRQVQLQQPMMF